MTTQITKKHLANGCKSQTTIPTWLVDDLTRSIFSALAGKRKPHQASSGIRILPPPWGIRKEVDKLTPEQVYDAYMLLSDDGKGKFLESIACSSTAEAVWIMLDKLDILERKRFSDRLFDEITWVMYPHIISEAVNFLKERPDVTDWKKFKDELAQHINESMKLYNESLSEVAETKIKRNRDRKSKPETIRRNVEICDLRKEGLSQGQLAKRFRITDAFVRKILKDESHWRLLLAQLNRTD